MRYSCGPCLSTAASSRAVPMGLHRQPGTLLHVLFLTASELQARCFQWYCRLYELLCTRAMSSMLSRAQMHSRVIGIGS
jgi:hypothetical protein